jgi:Uma2 family endonuclease
MQDSVPHPPTRKATAADLEALPPHLVGELIDGQLTAMSRPAFRHSRSASILGGLLMNPFDRGIGGPGGWWILDEPELHLGEDVVVPDLAGWRRERVPVFPDVPWSDIAPDWVCEVLSPSTRAHDLGPKRRVYARAGVKHLWLLDPIAQVLEVFELTGEHWLLAVTLHASGSAAVPPFDAVPFPLEALWT